MGDEAIDYRNGIQSAVSQGDAFSEQWLDLSAIPTPPREALIPFYGELLRQDDERLIFTGDEGERARITVVRVGEPEPGRDPGAPKTNMSSGERMVAVEVRVENIGVTRFRSDVEEHVRLVDDRGGEYCYDPDRTESPAAGRPDLLDPGAVLTRTVLFQVDQSATGIRALVA